MESNGLSFFRTCAEFCPKANVAKLPRGIRGIYALLKYRPRLNKYDVVYIGMARKGNNGVKARLLSHRRSTRKGSLWTHFSAYSAYPKVSDDQVAELEGMLRHIYRKDSHANKLAKAKSFRKFRPIRDNTFKWA